MKFDPVQGSDRGLVFTLRNDQGEAVGTIRSSFLSPRRGAFASNTHPGSLTAWATVFNSKTGVEVTVAEMSNHSCYTRKAADKAFRTWINDEKIRERLIEATRMMIWMNR